MTNWGKPCEKNQHSDHLASDYMRLKHDVHVGRIQNMDHGPWSTPVEVVHRSTPLLIF